MESRSLGTTGEITKPNGPTVVELCFNGSCQQAKTDAAAGPGSCVPVTSGTIVANVCFQGDTAGGKQMVNGQLDLAHAAPQDGDHYVLTISDEPSGAVLGKTDQNVQYAAAYPNGPDCPGECKTAKLKVAPP